MCRWLAYTGSPLQMESVLFKAKHSLIDQSPVSYTHLRAHET